MVLLYRIVIRKAYVSGQFYPSKSEDIEKFLKQFDSKPQNMFSAKGIILPHAGYIYSGEVVAQTIKRIIPKKRIIIFGPNHTGIGKNFAIFSKGSWQTPFGDLEIDEKLVQRIINAGDKLVVDSIAHSQEHSIEVELPILRYFFRDFKFVPISCSLEKIDSYQAVAKQIFEAIKDIKNDILLVASSDMSHYEEDSIVRRKDRMAIESILNLDEEELIARTKANNISICGIAPVSILIACCKLLQANKVEVARYNTSGDISGDYSAVVGYLGAIIH